MLADEDVARRRPRRAGKAPGQLARDDDRLAVPPALLQRVGEEVERLVGAWRAGILVEQLTVAGDGFRARIGGGAPVTDRGRLVALVRFRLRADAQGEPSRAEKACQPRQRLRLLRGRSA